jgi:hypothetical protein
MINVLHGCVHLCLAGIFPAGVQVTIEMRKIIAADFYPEEEGLLRGGHRQTARRV